MDSSDLIEKWRQKNKAYHFEGESGLEKLERLCKDLGYEGNNFRFGDPIQSFLADNYGATEAILEFIVEHVNKDPEWKESLAHSVDVDLDAIDEDDE